MVDWDTTYAETASAVGSLVVEVEARNLPCGSTKSTNLQSLQSLRICEFASLSLC